MEQDRAGRQRAVGPLGRYALVWLAIGVLATVAVIAVIELASA